MIQVAKKAFKDSSLRRIERPRPGWPTPMTCPHLVCIVLAPEPPAVPWGPASVPMLPQPPPLAAAARTPGRAELPADAAGDPAVGVGSRVPDASLPQDAPARARITALRAPPLAPLLPGRERASSPSQAQAAAEQSSKRQRTMEPGAGGGEGGLPQAPLADVQPGHLAGALPQGPAAANSSGAVAQDAQMPIAAPEDLSAGAGQRALRAPAAEEAQPRSTAAAVRLPAAETHLAQAAKGRKRVRFAEPEPGSPLQALLAEAVPGLPPHEPVATPSSQATAQLPMEAQEGPMVGASPRTLRAPAAVDAQPRSTAAAVRLPAAETDLAQAAKGRKRVRFAEPEPGGLLQAPLAEAEAGRPAGCPLPGPEAGQPSLPAAHVPQPPGGPRMRRPSRWEPLVQPAQAPAVPLVDSRLLTWEGAVEAWDDVLAERAGAAADAGPRSAGAGPAAPQRQAPGGAQHHVPAPPMGMCLLPLQAAEAQQRQAGCEPGLPPRAAGGSSTGVQRLSPLVLGMQAYAPTMPDVLFDVPAPAAPSPPTDLRLPPLQAAGLLQQPGLPVHSMGGASASAQAWSPLPPGVPAPAGYVSPQEPQLQPAHAAGALHRQAGHGPEAQMTSAQQHAAAARSLVMSSPPLLQPLPPGNVSVSPAQSSSQRRRSMRYRMDGPIHEERDDEIHGAHRDKHHLYRTREQGPADSMARGAATRGPLASPGPGTLSLVDLPDISMRVAAAAAADTARPTAGRGFNLAAGCAALRSQAAARGHPSNIGSPAEHAHGPEAGGGARPSG